MEKSTEKTREKTQKKSLNTSQLLNIIKKSSSFQHVDDVLHEQKDMPCFHHYLYQLMEEQGLSSKEIIAASGIERSYFYHILSGQKIPARNVILRICFCLSASLAKTNQLLRLANQGPLYARLRRDAAIIYCLEHGYSMQQANEFLIQQKEAPLYREERT